MSFTFPDFDPSLASYICSDKSVPLVTVMREYTGRYGRTYKGTKDYIIRIDDTDDHTGDKLRKSLQQSLIREPGFTQYLDANSTCTAVANAAGEANGAYLECKHVTIEKDEGLWFRYAFIANDFLTNNDCAVVLAYPDAQEAPKWCVFMDLIKLNNLLRLYSAGQTDGWYEYGPWSPVKNPNEAFEGTIRWAALNGQIWPSGCQAGTDRLLERPSCLLLDTVEVRPLKKE